MPRWTVTERFADYLTLARVVPSSAAALEVPLGALHGSAAPTVLARGAVTVWLVTAAANAFNDVRDIRADAVSAPDRPLPAGRITRRSALAFASLCAVTAVLLARFDGLACVIVVAALLVASGAYSVWLKGVPLLGNTVVAACAASALLYGSLLTRTLPVAVFLGAALIGSFMLCYELLKTLRDGHADRIAGYSTLVVSYGDRAGTTTLRSAAGLCTLLALVPLPVTPWPYGALIVLGVLLPLNAVAWFLPPDLPPAAVATAQRVLTVAWLPGLCAVALLVRHGAPDGVL